MNKKCAITYILLIRDKLLCSLIWFCTLNSTSETSLWVIKANLSMITTISISTMPNYSNTACYIKGLLFSYSICLLICVSVKYEIHRLQIYVTDDSDNDALSAMENYFWQLYYIHNNPHLFWIFHRKFKENLKQTSWDCTMK